MTVSADGPFSLYRLEKRGRTTLDSLAVIRQRWQIDARRISFGGLKDRQAHTIQHFTVFHGPERNLRHGPMAVFYMGRVSTPFTSDAIVGNRFRVVLRDMSNAEADALTARVGEVAAEGFPNYFDDQRFGSFIDGEFVGRLMVLGEYESALRLATEGRRGVEEYLRRRPGDHRGAVARLRPDLQGMYLGAYQAFIWNRMLAAGIGFDPSPKQGSTLESLPTSMRNRRTQLPDGGPVVVRTKVGDWPVPLPNPSPDIARLRELALPLPSARLQPDPLAVWWPWLERALEGQGHSLSQMKLRGLRKPFFSRGERPAWIVPRGVSCEVGDDDRFPRRRKATVAFELPRGSYATILIKCLGATALAAPDDPVE